MDTRRSSDTGGAAASPGAIWVAALPPFDLALTARVLQRTAANPFDRWDGQTYRRLYPQGEVCIRQQGPGVRVWGPIRPAQVRRLLGLDVDMGPLEQAAAADPALAPLVTAFPGLKPPRFPTLWETLCNALACQQVSLAAGIAALRRLAERCGTDRGSLLRVPDPEAVLETDLGGLGLSRQKQAALRGLAHLAREGALDGLQELPTAEVYRRLCALPGVGRWSAEYALLRGLGRHEVFPADDVGAARVLASLAGQQRLDVAELRRRSLHWGPGRGLVYFLLLAARRAGERPSD